MGTIAKITVDGSTHLLASTAYAICSTEANIAEKTAVLQDNNEFILFTGVTVHIKFTASNSAAMPTLNINGTGAYFIKQYGTTSVGNTEATSWKAGATLSVTFDGNYWQLNGASSTGSEYTNEEKTKLAGIESGAEVNVQSDWAQTNSSADDYIKNKPTIPTKTSDLTNDSGFLIGVTAPDVVFQAQGTNYLDNESEVDGALNALDSAIGNKVDKVSGKGLSTNDYTTAEKDKLADIAEGAEVNVQSDWNQTDSTADDFIKNKPTIPTVPTNISAFTNDVGYLTSHQNISGKVNRDGDGGLGNMVFANDRGVTFPYTINDVQKLVHIRGENDGSGSGYSIAINGHDFGQTANTSPVRLTNVADPIYSNQAATKNYVDGRIPTKTSDLTNDSGFITSDTEINGYPLDQDITLDATNIYTDSTGQTTLQQALNGLNNDITSIQSDVGTKSSVSWSQLVSSGVQIASINIDGNTVQVFAPTSGGGSSYTPTIRINGSDYSILRWEKTVLNNISGINFVYQDGSLESTLFVPDNEGISYIINQIPTQPSDIGALSSADLEMEMDSVDLKQLDIYFSTEGGSGHPSTSSNMIETTWANLKTLRDNSQLVKGAWYRITDYNFITTRLGLQSGNHQFDIVLLAISESMLSESGYACRHAEDHYFEREVTEGGIEWLYTLYVDDYAENYGGEAVDHSDDIHSVDAFCDSAVLPHPDTGDDVPALYKTNIEEYDIDDPDYDDVYFYEGTYDLDGDEYDMWSKYEPDPDTGDLVFMQQYALTPIVVEDGELIVSPIPETKLVPVNMNAWELKYCLDNDKKLFDWAATDGKGVIYYLKDEFGNEAPYDFKNAMFQRKNITSVSSNILSIFTQGENSRLGLPGNHAVTTGNNNYYYYTFDTPYNVGNDSSLFGESAYNVIKPYIMDGQRIINNIVLGFANNNSIGNNCFDLTIWGTVRDNTLKYNCSNLLMVGLTQSTMTYVRSSTFFSLGATTFGNGCSQNIGSMFTNSEIGDSCNNNNFGTGNMGIKTGSGCANNTFGTYCYNNTFDNGVSNCTFGNYCSYNKFETSAQSITLPNYVRYCKFELGVSRITFTTSGGSNSSYIQYVTVCRGISNLSIAPSRGAAYEQIYYKNGRIETAV
jgi:hypothetical protein